jgi:hypothetical protein
MRSLRQIRSGRAPTHCKRDEDDWPVLAAALTFGCPIWTEDTDFFGCGVATWTTDRVELYLATAQGTRYMTDRVHCANVLALQPTTRHPRTQESCQPCDPRAHMLVFASCPRPFFPPIIPLS